MSQWESQWGARTSRRPIRLQPTLFISLSGLQMFCPACMIGKHKLLIAAWPAFTFYEALGGFIIDEVKLFLDSCKCFFLFYPSWRTYRHRWQVVTFQNFGVSRLCCFSSHVTVFHIPLHHFVFRWVALFQYNLPSSPHLRTCHRQRCFKVKKRRPPLAPLVKCVTLSLTLSPRKSRKTSASCVYAVS